MAGRFRFVAVCGALIVAAAGIAAAGAEPSTGSAAAATAKFVDLSLMVSPELPGPWPAAGFPPFHMNGYLRIGPLSAYNSEILALDGNTGTQLDVPPHSIPHPDTNLPNAGP